MNILPHGADRKLFEISSSIAQAPKTWDGWFCLQLDLNISDDALYKESLNMAISIIKTHLKDIRGDVFICENKTIHILCKPPSDKVLEQTGAQICDLISLENSVKTSYRLYDLFEQGYDYSQNITGQTNSIFKLPNENKTKQTQKHDNNNHTHDIILLKQPDNISKSTLSSRQNTVKVLLVEDDPITRWMVRNSLKDICDFATAPTASKACSLYTSYRPDVVFLDINLPDKNGRSVLDWIIEHDPGACVVMFSSNGSLDNITQCLNNGASGFVTKPFLREDLLHYVQHRAG